MVFYMAQLGWSPWKDDNEEKERGALTLKELIERFDPKDLVKTPARFDVKKLQHYNMIFIRRRPQDEQRAMLKGALERKGYDLSGLDDTRADALLHLYNERFKTFGELAESAGFLFQQPPTYLPEAVEKCLKKEPQMAAALTEIATLLQTMELSDQALEAPLRALAEKTSIKFKNLMQGLRVAVTGSQVSPPLFETIRWLGLEKTLARIATAKGLIGG